MNKYLVRGTVLFIIFTAPENLKALFCFTLPPSVPLPLYPLKHDGT